MSATRTPTTTPPTVAAESAPEDDDGDGGGGGGGGGQRFLWDACGVAGFGPGQTASDRVWLFDERWHVTDRVCVPNPHDAEHEDHEPVVYEYVRHACVLHA